jgi:hypothetical protein
MNAERLPGPAGDMPARLSTMWVFVMLNMIFADILSFLDPSFLRDVSTGSVGGVEISQGFLFAVAVVTEVAIAMVVLSRVLRYRLNRWANMIAASVTIAYVILGGSAAPHYLFFATMEVVCCGLIAWFAWRWPDSALSPVAHGESDAHPVAAGHLPEPTGSGRAPLSAPMIDGSVRTAR